MEDNKLINESKETVETTIASDFSQANENAVPLEEIDAVEFGGSEPRTTRATKKVDNSNLTKMMGFTTGGLAAAVGTIIISAGSLVNYQYTAQFNEMYFDDNRIYYQLEFDEYIDTENDLVIKIYQDKKEVAQYTIITSFDQFSEEGLGQVTLYVDHKDTEYDLDDTPLSEVLALTNDIDYVEFGVENEYAYQSYQFYNQGSKAIVNGYFSLDADAVVSKVEANTPVYFDATLSGSAGLVDRTFDNYAIKITNLVSEFNSIEGKCHCEVDGTYKVTLNYLDNYSFFGFYDLYIEDSYNNQSGHIESLIDWHQEINIPVLNLRGGSATIHLKYYDAGNDRDVELIFRDGSSTIYVRYDSGDEEVFKETDVVFDIKI